MSTQPDKSDTERARLASSLLNNPLLDEAFAVQREAYVQAMMVCKPDDNEGRWRYAAALRDLTIVRAHFEVVLQRGELAKQQAESLQERENVFKRAARGFANG